MLWCFCDRHSATWTNHIGIHRTVAAALCPCDARRFDLYYSYFTQAVRARTNSRRLDLLRFVSQTSGRLDASLRSFSCLHVPAWLQDYSLSCLQDCFMRASCLSLAVANCSTTARYRKARATFEYYECTCGEECKLIQHYCRIIALRFFPKPVFTLHQATVTVML